MFNGVKCVAMLLVMLFDTEPVLAQSASNIRPRAPTLLLRKNLPPNIKIPMPLLRVKVRPSQAAAIAQGQVPYSTVVGVKLLPSGIYAVTLRTDTSVERIMVDGQSGEIN